jgi:hypothetical protein
MVWLTGYFLQLIVSSDEVEYSGKASELDWDRASIEKKGRKNDGRLEGRFNNTTL